MGLLRRGMIDRSTTNAEVMRLVGVENEVKKNHKK